MTGTVKRIALALLALTMCLCLTACLKSVEDMYVLPKTAQQDAELQKTIDLIRSQGAEYETPRSGETRQSSVTVDLDGDGNDEFICFFKVKGDTNPLKVVVFWKTKNQQEKYQYDPSFPLSSQGDAIESFNCCDLDGDGNMELIIGWREDILRNDGEIYSDKDSEKHTRKTLEIYTTRREKVPDDSAPTGTAAFFSFDLTGITDYSDFRLCQFGGDENPEMTNVFVIRRKQNEGSSSEFEAVVYTPYRNGERLGLKQCNSAPLSKTVESVKKIILSKLSDNTPAAFVDSINYNQHYLTDIFIFSDFDIENPDRRKSEPELVNLVTLKENTKESTVKTFINPLRPFITYCADIDGDGYVEVPAYIELKNGNRFTSEYALRWYSFSSNPNKPDKLKMTTYNNTDNTWYYILPDDNPDESIKDKISVKRENGYGVQSVIFSYIGGSSSTDVMKITAFTGERKSEAESLEEDPTRFILGSDETGSTVYVCEILNTVVYRRLTMNAREKFKLNYPEWNSREDVNIEEQDALQGKTGGVQ